AGFAKRNVSDTLGSLVASRAAKARWSRNERHYIVYRNKWATLLEVDPSAEFLPEFVSWVHLLPASLRIVDWLDHVAVTEDSEYLISSRARDLMERIAPDLEMAGLDFPGFTNRGAAYLPVFVNTVDSLLAKIEAAHRS